MHHSAARRRQIWQTGSARNARTVGWTAARRGAPSAGLLPNGGSVPTGTRSAKPSRLVTGISRFSTAPRSPASAPMRLVMTISPPGRSTRANSSSAFSGFRHRRDDVLRHDNVEGRIRKIQVLRIHDREPLDVVEAQSRHPLARLAQHRRRDIDAVYRIAARVSGERKSGADADLQDTATDAFCCGDRRAATGPEHGTEYQIIDRRPSPVGLHDRVFV